MHGEDTRARTRSISSVDEHEDAVCGELLFFALDAKIVKTFEHRLALVVLDEVTLQLCQRRPTQPELRNWVLTTSRAIRAWISYTVTVKSFFIRCTY